MQNVLISMLVITWKKYHLGKYIGRDKDTALKPFLRTWMKIYRFPFIISDGNKRSFRCNNLFNTVIKLEDEHLSIMGSDKKNIKKTNRFMLEELKAWVSFMSLELN